MAETSVAQTLAAILLEHQVPVAIALSAGVIYLWLRFVRWIDAKDAAELERFEQARRDRDRLVHDAMQRAKLASIVRISDRRKDGTGAA